MNDKPIPLWNDEVPLHEYVKDIKYLIYVSRDLMLSDLARRVLAERAAELIKGVQLRQIGRDEFMARMVK